MVPFPPPHLIERVHGRRDQQSFEDLGRLAREEVISILPDDWAWPSKRVLDFGCGPGRTLRHCLKEARECEFWGCDIDARSIEWVDANLSPPFHTLVNEDRPPLPFPDNHFDLVLALSVFSHLTETWAEWMAELHRVVSKDGLLVVVYSGEGVGAWFDLTREYWHGDRLGMATIFYGESFVDSSGPQVLHSRWWIEEHWGRAFEILDGRSSGYCFPGQQQGQGILLMRPRDTAVGAADLERIDPGDPREVEALRYQVELLLRETATIRAGAARDMQALKRGGSWRLTAPLRRLRGLTRSRT